MTITISIGSGKGGVGKSVTLANIALALAKSGRKVCIVDFDLGGADSHILFGLNHPRYSLTDFLEGRVGDITELIHTFDSSLYGLQIIPGTGDTLQSSNMSYQEKQKLLRTIKGIDADIVLLDVGAGSSYHTLDFFMAADIQICITQPEPTSIMDFYNFLQLATIRKILEAFLATGKVGTSLRKQSFSTLGEAFKKVEEIEGGAREKAQNALRYFNPLLIVNRVDHRSRVNRNKLHEMTKKYLGIHLPDLGDIPKDEAVPESVKACCPVLISYPNSPAGLAYLEIAERLGKIVDLYREKTGLASRKVA